MTFSLISLFLGLLGFNKRNNLLTYYRGPAMKTAFHRIVDRLEDGGILILGSHERPPPESPSLLRDSVCLWVHWMRRASGESTDVCKEDPAPAVFRKRSDRPGC